MRGEKLFMSKIYEITATPREVESGKVLGKRPSRRLRSTDNIPAVLYGGTEKAPMYLSVGKHAFAKLTKEPNFYFSLLTLHINNTKETALLKALQRHPIDSNRILHLDFLRVDKNQQINFRVPLHFTGETEASGIQEGGMVSHLMSDIEIKCLVKDLPDSVTVDLSKMKMDQTLHLSDLKLPKGIELAHPMTSSDDDLPVVSIHKQKVAVEEPEAVVIEEEVAPAAAE